MILGCLVKASICVVLGDMRVSFEVGYVRIWFLVLLGLSVLGFDEMFFDVVCE